MTGIRKEYKAYTVFADQREVCHSTSAGKAEYKRRREEMWDRDRGLCCLCGQPVSLDECTFEHTDGRGMGGSKRDDRVEKNGVSHLFGNGAKGSIPYRKWMLKPLWERIAACRGL